MRFFSRKRLLRGVAIYAVLLSTIYVLTALERRRLAATVTQPSSTPAGPAIDTAALMADVRRLAGPEFDGRRTGTAGSAAAQEVIVQRFRDIGAQPAFTTSYRQPFGFTRRSIRSLLHPSRPFRTEYPNATNLAALIPGASEPQRYIVLSAHYDHFGRAGGELFPGADDNASGVAVMLAVGAGLARQRPRRSVLLFAPDAEELGLRGAAQFVRDPPVPLAAIQAIVNMDMVGRSDAGRLVAAGTRYNPWLAAPVRAAALRRRIPVVFGHDRPMYLAGMVDNWTQSSDHGPFHTAGVPFLYFGVEDHPDYHRPTDTADRISGTFIGEVAALVAEVIRNLDALDGGR